MNLIHHLGGNAGKKREFTFHDNRRGGEPSGARRTSHHLLCACTHPKALSGLPEHGLHVDDGLGVRHVVLLGAHGALLVHDHQVVGVNDAALKQVVQAGPLTKRQRSKRLVWKWFSARYTV